MTTGTSTVARLDRSIAPVPRGTSGLPRLPGAERLHCPCNGVLDTIFPRANGGRRMEKKVQPRLGRGLDALFGGSGNGTNEKHHAKPEGPATKVAVAAIQMNPYQPRKHFDE